MRLNHPLLLASALLITTGCGKNNTQQNGQGQGGNQSTQTVTNTSTGTSTNTSTSTLTKVSFVLTNDIHGHLEPQMTSLSGIVTQLRALPEYQNNQAALFLLDSGDQFQGTLPSNFNEGETMFKVFNQMKYDAIIPGNHDYDFGPLGWLWDQVTPEHNDGGPRGVIQKLQKLANFPMLSANTYIKAKVKMKGTGAAVTLDDSCQLTNATLTPNALDFSAADIRPDFLKPYVIIQKAGIRVALIGIDHHLTTANTTKANVSDLCFRNEADAYLEVRKSLEGQADVFVMLMHNGDVPPGTHDATDITQKILTQIPNSVDLVAAGHTHRVHDSVVSGVHVIQDGANGEQFGRVDLFLDPSTKKVLTDKTNSWAGMSIDPNKCDQSKPKAAFICTQIKLPVLSDAVIDGIVLEANKTVAPIAKQKLAVANTTLSITRNGENVLGNILTDALRQASGTQVAIMNSGGIRTNLKKGDVLYENLFEVLPFQNLAVVMNKFPWKNLKAVLLASVQSCGKYGSLVQSGLKIQYTSSGCDSTQMYQKAELNHVELLDGTVLFDKATNTETTDDSTVSLTTLDFLSAGGGDGYSAFSGITIDASLGINRDIIRDGFLKTIPTLDATIDGRFKNLAPAPKEGPSEDHSAPIFESAF